MWIILIVGVVIVVGALAALLFSRPRASDLSSVRKYHSALGTIEHMADRTGQPAGRVMPPGGPPGSEGAGGGRSGRTVPPVPVRGRDGFPDPESPIVFDDARPRNPVAGVDDNGEYRARGAPMHRVDRAQRHALESMNHRPRRTTAVMVVVILVALFATLVILGSRHPKSAARDHRSVSTSSTSPPAHHGSQAKAHSQAGGHGHKSDGPSTTTTVPTQIVALSSTPLTAVYPVGSNSYTVKVSASGPCWVLATESATGSTLWTGTLQAGGSQVIKATGVITVQLGAPSATMALDNVPVVFPSPVHTPFVATFQPGAAVGGTSSPSTTAPVASTTTTAG